MNTNSTFPRRGEVWSINFDPALGAEIKKKRPENVVSSDAIGKLPIKLVAPITEWKDRFTKNIWHVKIKPDSSNGLSKISAVDVLQLRGMDVQRFITKLGHISSTVMEEVAAALAAIIEYE